MTTWLRLASGLVGLLAALLTALPARADGSAADDLIRAGREAARQGAYGFAIQALLRAEARTGDSRVLFEVAEAHRRRHARGGDPYDLARAVASYRRYLTSTPPTAPRRPAAERHLAALSAQLERQPPTPDDMARGRRLVTRLGVVATPLTAEVSVDGGPFAPAPRFVDLSPGRHQIRVRATDHEAASRVVDLARGGVAALKVALAPEPAELVILGAEDATVHLDGRRIDRPEEGEPLRVVPGDHFVAITQTGFHPSGHRIDLEAGSRRVLPVDLEATAQRAAALSLLIAGGVGLTSGIVLGATSVAADRGGRRADADRFRVASGGAGVGGALLLVAGGALLLLDEPSVPGPDAPEGAARLHLTPTLGPHRVGAGLSLSF